jgi:O-antigen ligase
MELYLIAIIAILVPLYRPPLRLANAHLIKFPMVYVVSLGYVCYLILFGYKMVTSYVCYSIFLLALYTTLSASWSSNIEQSWKDIVKWWSLLGIFTMAANVPVNSLMVVSIIPIPFFIAWGFLQYSGHEPFDKDMKYYVNNSAKIPRRLFLGGMGNTNHAAAFLAPYLFINIYLAINVSIWFAVLIPFIIAGVILTKCYSAMLGVLAGMCFIYPPYSLWLLLCIPIGVCASIVLYVYYPTIYEKVIGTKRLNFMSRIYYWKVAFELWKKKPIFGWGPDSFKKELFECQAEMNQKDQSLLGYKDDAKDIPSKYTPYPEKAHNDYVQFLADGGIVGFILILLFVASIIYSAILSGNYILLGGAICLAVHGVFFFTISTLSFVPYMILGAALSPSPILYYAVPLPIALIGVLAIIRLCVTHAINPVIASILAQKAVGEANEEKRENLIDKAISFDSTNSQLCMIAVDVKVQKDRWIALHYMEHAIHCFDGIMQLPILFLKYGELQNLCGNLDAAQKAFKYALYLNPRLDRARFLLKKIAMAEQNKRNDQIMRLVKPNAVGVK